MKQVVLAAVAALIIVSVFRSEPVFSHSVVNTTVTFDREISRIIKKRCIACHSDQNLGVPLTAYEEVRPWTGSIHEEILRRHMPPWRAIAGYGEFANDGSLTSRELQFMLAWIEGNGPKSKEKIIFNFEQMKTPDDERIKGDFDKWQLGKPDLLKTLTPNTIGPDEGDVTKRVEIDLGLRSERWVRGLEFKPGDRRIVRGATFFLRETGQWIGSWTPWYGTMSLPADTGFHVPAGGHVVAEIHYRGSNQPITDAGSLGVYFTDKAVIATPQDVTVEAAPVAARPGANAGGMAKFEGARRLDTDTTILAINPDVPHGVNSFSVSARQPNGVVKPVLLVRDALAEWPTPYIPKTPLQYPKGTEFLVAYQFDPSAGTPAPERMKLTLSVIGGSAAVDTK
jgi:hypothetical protein